MVQEVGFAHLREQIDLIAADSPRSFVDDTPTAIDKAMIVARLKGPRSQVGRGRSVASFLVETYLARKDS